MDWQHINIYKLAVILLLAHKLKKGHSRTDHPTCEDYIINQLLDAVENSAGKGLERH